MIALEQAKMLGFKINQSKKYRRTKRIYLGILLTLTLTLCLSLCVPTGPAETQTSLPLVFSPNRINLPSPATATAKQEKPGQSQLLRAFYDQLAETALAGTLEEVAAQTPLISPLWSSAATAEIRQSLLGEADGIADGRLSLTPSEDVSNGSPNSDHLTYTLSIRGSGSVDEALFLRCISKKIAQQICPQHDSQQISTYVKTIRDHLLTAEKQNKQLRESINITFQRYLGSQKKQVHEDSGDESAKHQENVAEDWELNKLLQQRSLTVEEYNANQKTDFASKESIQKRLFQRIQYLDQAIQSLKDVNKTQARQFAENGGRAEKATFADTSSINVQPFELETIRSDVALLNNKMDLTDLKNKENIDSISNLSSIIDTQSSELRLGTISRSAVTRGNTGRSWIYLLFSAAISTVIVMRIPSTAFGRYFPNTNRLEKILQVPVIGTAALPKSEITSHPVQIVRQSQMVHYLTRTCEAILLISITIVFCLVLMKTDPGMGILTQPAMLLEQSLHTIVTPH